MNRTSKKHPSATSSRQSNAFAAGLVVRRAPIASLVPDPANARTHGPANLDAITASLRRSGQAEPLVVQAPRGA